MRFVLFAYALCLSSLLFVGNRAEAGTESPLGFYEGRPQASWDDAGQFIGKVARITGKIVKVNHSQTIHFLEFHETDRSAFKVVIFEGSLKNFTGDLADRYQGKFVRVNGRVGIYSGNPQIVVSHPDQIEVLTSLPSAPVESTSSTVKSEAADMLGLMTFNVRNLFDADDDIYTLDEETVAKPRRELEQIAAVIRAQRPDVLALQEVESRHYLERFVEVLLPDLGYEQIVHFEGNDGRGIDVCLISRLPIGKVTSHRHLRFPGVAGERTSFRRDLLCVEVLPRAEVVLRYGWFISRASMGEPMSRSQSGWPKRRKYGGSRINAWSRIRKRHS